MRLIRCAPLMLGNIYSDGDLSDFQEIKYDKKWKVQECIDYLELNIAWCKKVKDNGYKWTAYYKKSAKCPDFGRDYGNGIQRLTREIRGFLTGDIYTDYDMKNAHPTLLIKLCNDYNVPIPPSLDEYVNNRAHILELYEITKLDVLTTMNKDRLYKCQNLWLQKFHTELKPLKDKLWEEHSDLCPGKQRTHKKSSVMNKLLCKEEAIVLDLVIKECKVFNPVKMFDGFMTEGEPLDLETMNRLTERWNIIWDIKPPTPFIYPEDRVLIPYVKEKKKCLIKLTDKEKEIIPITSYDSVKEEFEKTNFICENPTEYCSTDNLNGEDILHRESKTNFMNKYEPLTYVIETKDGTERRGFCQAWFKDPSRRTYKNIDFIPPPEICPPYTFNLFTGFRHHKLEESGVIPDDDIKIFLDHFKLMSGSDQTEDIYVYLINYFAHLIQFPGLLPRTAILLNSPPGFGKNMLVDNFGRKIFGNKYHESTSNADRFVGRWKTIMGKFMGVYNEASSKDTFGLDGKMKELITEPVLDFEVKCKTPINIKNFMRLIILTNKDNGVRIDPSDRRFQVIEISGKKQNKEYFEAYSNAWENDEKVLGLVNYLKNIDISKWNPENDRVKTDVYKSMMSINVHTREKFLVDFVNTLDTNVKNNVFSPTHLYSTYCDWMKERNMKPETHTMFGMKLKKSETWGDAIVYSRTKKGRSYTFDKEKLINVLVDRGSMVEDEIDEEVTFEGSPTPL